MADNLKIRIIGTLNSGATIGEINSAIKGIEKKINTIKLNIQIDDKVSKTLADFSKAMENHKKIAQDLNRVIKEEKTVTKEADGTIREKIRQHLKSGEIMEKEIKRTNDKTKATQQETKAIEENNKAIQRQGELLKRRYDQDAEGQKKLKSETYKDGYNKVTYNTETGKAKVVQNVDQERKATENLTNSKRQLKDQLKLLNNEGKVSAENFAKLNKAIDNSKNIQQTQRLQQNLENLNRIRDNEHKLEMARQQAQVNAQRIRTTHGGFVDNTALNQYTQSVDNLTPRTANLNQQLQRSSAQFTQVAQNARSAAGAAQQAGMSFGEMLSTAMTKFPIWMISATAFYAPIRALEDMTSRLIEIDSLMVNIQRVMDMPDFKFTQLLEDAVQVSDELSSKLTDVLSIMGDFGRMGFKENELIDISSTAQVLQNISDLDANAAVDTLTSAMLNFNIAAKDSITIADQLNEIDNNFAVTTKDLSDGLRKSASTAKTFGVEMSDLVGYIAAIGSTTRESGNIIGK
ncbi:hypothetical protein AF332_11190 [Sporosarcina globispora]|uniref:Phage tail tape measure protein domain-containing protein n=1 Tax=Sporosarcina globispora TaxID=1459 RepID=A0A0M0GBW5_SPOGL|nr:phage tail tape measure protein [Sporosarcina globispora]KON87334.1 hypothetical protein AF332_11190 [Sporosarcina globispora]